MGGRLILLMHLIYGTLTSMAKKKNKVSKKPVEPETTATAVALVEETPVEEQEPGAPEASSSNTQETAQADTEETEASEEPAVEPPEPPETPEAALADVPDDPDATTHGAVKAPRLSKRRSVVLISLAVLAVVIGIYFLVKPSYTTPLPKSVTQQASFKAYYPQSSDNTYAYAPNSASYVDGKLSYTIVLKNAHTEGASPFVRVSETALVGKGPDLTQLPNFTVFNAPAGKAAISPDGQVLNGVLVTDKTLVILNGLGGITRPELMQIIKSM